MNIFSYEVFEKLNRNDATCNKSLSFHEDDCILKKVIYKFTMFDPCRQSLLFKAFFSNLSQDTIMYRVFHVIFLTS